MRLRLAPDRPGMEADLGDARLLGVIDVAPTPAIADPATALRDALAAPLGMPGHALGAFRPGDTVCIIVSDSFRRTEIHQLLPALLEELARRGIGEREVRFLFATGTHRPPTEAEQRRILGEAVWNRFQGRLFTHDPDDEAFLVDVGTTRRGTPVALSRHALDCDRIIATGAAVLHYFGGVGGGPKAVLPGIASRAAIAHNHALNLDPHADSLNPAVRIGRLEGNPVAEDMREGARLAPVSCIVNTVLNAEGGIGAVVAGDMLAAHGRAAALAREWYARPIPERADLVVAASLHTANFVQTHKALYNAWQAMGPGGRIVLVAPCPEGPGGEQFVKWLRLGSREAIFDGLRRQSEINGQTALSTLEKAPSTLFVTAMGEEDVALLGGRRAATLQAAVDEALAALHRAGRAAPTVWAMPNAALTVPRAAAEDRV